MKDISPQTVRDAHLGNLFLTEAEDANLPPHILVTTNSPGFDACEAVLIRAEALGVLVRCEEGPHGRSPLSISRLDDLEAFDEPVHLPYEPYDDEDAAQEVIHMGYRLVLLPDFFEGSEEDDGTRCGDGSIPSRWYVVEALQ